ASRALHEILQLFAPTIEPRGYGHAFLDITGTSRLFGPPQDVAARLGREVRTRLRFPISVGIAGNKLVSQAAIRADLRTEPAAMNFYTYRPATNGNSWRLSLWKCCPSWIPTCGFGWTNISWSWSGKSRLSPRARSVRCSGETAECSGPEPGE